MAGWQFVVGKLPTKWSDTPLKNSSRNQAGRQQLPDNTEQQQQLCLGFVSLKVFCFRPKGGLLS